MATHIDGWLEESSDYELFATLVGDDGLTAIDPAIVTELTATLRDEITGALLLQNQDVLNTNGGALVDVAARNFTLQLTPLETASLSAHRYQKRILTLNVTHSGGLRHHQEVSFTVENLADLTAMSPELPATVDLTAARGRDR